MTRYMCLTHPFLKVYSKDSDSFVEFSGGLTGDVTDLNELAALDREIKRGTAITPVRVDPDEKKPKTNLQCPHEDCKFGRGGHRWSGKTLEAYKQHLALKHGETREIV